MNTLATRDPFTVAMSSATVTASGTMRCTWLTATVMTVPAYNAAPTIMYVRMFFLISAGSECIACLFLLEQVQHREQEDPHEIDEVPVQARDLDAIRELLRIRLLELRARPEEIRHHHDPAEDVQSVQPGQREVDAEKRAVPRSLALRQVLRILEVLVHEEERRQQNGGHEIDAVLRPVVQLERHPRHHHRDRRPDQDEGV